MTACADAITWRYPDGEWTASVESLDRCPMSRPTRVYGPTVVPGPGVLLIRALSRHRAHCGAGTRWFIATLTLSILCTGLAAGPVPHGDNSVRAAELTRFSPERPSRDFRFDAATAGPTGVGVTPGSAGVGRMVDPGLVDITGQIASRDTLVTGTGMVLTSDGEVLTNNHVIAGVSKLRVTDVGDGHTYLASVVGRDATHDIAVLQLRAASGLRTVPLGNSATVRVGDHVTAVGNAGGEGGTPSAATGLVTALGRTIDSTDESGELTERLVGLIQLAAHIEPGDSGGPLVDDHGRVVAVNVATQVNAHTGNPNGVGFAIPINTAIAAARRIVARSTAVRPRQ